MSFPGFLHKHPLILVFLLFSILLCGQQAQAQRVALLPLADISKGENGINLQLTKAVETSLKQLDVELVSRNQIMLFMARNKVRTYRYLDSYMIKKLGAEFDCSLILTGTVTELDEKNPRVGITFTALDVIDGAPIWSTSGSASKREEIRMFGVGEPQSVIELLRPILNETLAPLAEIAHQVDSLESRDYQLAGLHLSPGYVQGGGLVEAELKIVFLGKRPTFIAAESVVGKSYLQYDRRTDSYQGEWYAPRDEGTYQVDLRLEWGRERTVEKLKSVASFEVINQAPGLKIEIKKAIQVGQRLAFRNHILILPRVDNLRPMAGWALEIKRNNGTIVAYEEYKGDLPERMVWEGRNGEGVRLPTGAYQIGVEVWDLAGNRSSDSRRIVLQASAPKVAGMITHFGDEARLTLSNKEYFEFPLVSWQAQLHSMTGRLLAKGKGRELPANLHFTPVAGEEFAYLTIEGEDLLGNRLRVKREKLRMTRGEKQVEEQKAESWVPDF